MHTDGGARGNPGPAGIGVVITDPSGKVLAELSEYIGAQTNNYAEYEALIQGLLRAQKLFGSVLREMQVEVRMDSELVVRQLNGIYKVKEPTLKEKFATVAKLRQEVCPNATFVHVYREQNKHADQLVNAAIDAHV